MKGSLLFFISRKIELDWWYIARYEKRMEKMLRDNIPLNDTRYRKTAQKIYKKKKEAKNFACYYEIIAGIRTNAVCYI